MNPKISVLSLVAGLLAGAATNHLTQTTLKMFVPDNLKPAAALTAKIGSIVVGGLVANKVSSVVTENTQIIVETIKTVDAPVIEEPAQDSEEN